MHLVSAESRHQLRQPGGQMASSRKRKETAAGFWLRANAWFIECVRVGIVGADPERGWA
jgi:hypothetical protein